MHLNLTNIEDLRKIAEAAAEAFSEQGETTWSMRASAYERILGEQAIKEREALESQQLYLITEGQLEALQAAIDNLRTTPSPERAPVQAPDFGPDDREYQSPH